VFERGMDAQHLGSQRTGPAGGFFVLVGPGAGSLDAVARACTGRRTEHNDQEAAIRARRWWPVPEQDEPQLQDGPGKVRRRISRESRPWHVSCPSARYGTQHKARGDRRRPMVASVRLCTMLQPTPAAREKGGRGAASGTRRRGSRTTGTQTGLAARWGGEAAQGDDLAVHRLPATATKRPGGSSARRVESADQQEQRHREEDGRRVIVEGAN